MSIELCFLVNLLADFSLIAATARGLGHLRLHRVGSAAALSALYGTLAQGMPALAGPPVQLILLIPLSMLVTRRTSLRGETLFALSLAVTAIVTGACAVYCGSPILAVAGVPAICGMLTGARRRDATALSARIEVVNRGRTSVLHACIDTGNRLTEPLSGQPVLIANESLIRDILPDSGFRAVAFGSVGGAGTLRCFRPDRVYIVCDGSRRRAPDTWIAVFPARLPGPAQALAPAEYILE